MVTIKDLARLAGVSPTTVSNVLHDRTEKVSPETLIKVQQVIKETKYVSNMGGRLLAKHGSRIISVILTEGHRDEINVTQSPFMSEIIGSLEESIRSNGYFMMLYTSADYEESIRLATAWNTEGLIVLGSTPKDAQRFIDESPIPMVFIDTYLDGENPTFYNVGLLDYEGSKMMTKYLFAKGCRKVAFLADWPEPVGVDLERLKGFQAAYREEGFSYDEEYFIPIDYRREVRHAMLREFAKGRMRNFDALFFSSDFYAVDSMNLLFELGFDVPRDISVVGFDNNILAEQSRPRLTTINQNTSSKGHLAVEMLVALLQQEKINQKNVMLPVSLVQGKSVKS
ncbi:LacI family DNA-binding transcriptional regulator [Enterococcus sp. 2201sp1_2201st1_B8_2201SCRN_220225]|uniref:LacI family DNA-binding transcriptional regulator n=1 Tax=unclassified Enterococcus TaxID=2608891 RepID=UPI0034A4FA48